MRLPSFTPRGYRPAPPRSRRASIAAAGLALVVVLQAGGRGCAAEPVEASTIPDGAAAATDLAEPDRWAAHLQLTNVTQRHPRFNSPYQGANSLNPIGRTEETTDITADLGARLWRGAELWVDPEVDQGFGFDKTVGLAGFSSGEAYKIGANAPYLRVPRLFVHQTIALGGAAQALPGQANQFAASTTADHIALTVGKFSVVDVFDTNRYAHDPRGDFLNWSIIDAGPFDYAADAWGFTYGGAVELGLGDWSGRVGAFQLSPVPNGKIVAVDFGQSSYVGELERRQQWFGGPGTIKLLAFVNRASMGSYADAVERGRRTDTTPDIASVRHRASRAGVGLNIEQALADGVGLFFRASANDGTKEAYEFTEINRSIASGVSIDGGRWRRAGDTVGVAAVVNQLSRQARAFFAAGGLGILIGDGRLDYGNEKIVETYYAAQLVTGVKLSFDYQRVVNPAYNRDRGPVSIYSVRLHLER